MVLFIFRRKEDSLNSQNKGGIEERIKAKSPFSSFIDNQNLLEEIERKKEEAIQRGIEILIEDHPALDYDGKGKQILSRYINEEEISRKIQELYNQNKEKGIDSNFLENLYLEIAKGVVSGEFLNERGKYFVLKKGLEEEVKKEHGFRWFGWFRSRPFSRIKEAEKELDRTLAYFNDLYELMKEGKYKEEMPNIEKPLTEIYKAGFLIPALDLLLGAKVINKNEYRDLKNLVYEKVKESKSELRSSIENYIRGYQGATTASIFILIGGIIFFMGNNITASVIGYKKIPVYYFKIFGILFLLMGLLIVFFIIKKSFSKKNLKKKIKRKKKN